MKDKLIDILHSLLYGLVVGFPGILAITLILIWLYALITYGDKPITEIPSWAFWMLK